MQGPCRIALEPFGDGWAPSPALLCPMLRREPENCGSSVWCVNSSDTAICGCFRGTQDGYGICVYNLSEAEDKKVCDDMEAGRPVDFVTQGGLRDDDKCSVCGCNRFVVAHVGPHIGHYCGKCGKWLMWLQKPIKTNDPAYILPFGKHAGTKISMVPTDYLVWGIEHFRGRTQKRFQLAFDHRALMFCMYLFQAFEECHEPNFLMTSLAGVRRAFIKKHSCTSQGFKFWLDIVSDRKHRSKPKAYSVFFGSEPKNRRIKLIGVQYYPAKMDSV